MPEALSDLESSSILAEIICTDPVMRNVKAAAWFVVGTGLTAAASFALDADCDPLTAKNWLGDSGASGLPGPWGASG